MAEVLLVIKTYSPWAMPPCLMVAGPQSRHPSSISGRSWPGSGGSVTTQFP
jgi:hypothetical protein